MEKSQTRAIRPDEVEGIFLEHTNAEGMMPIVLGMQSSSGIDLVDEESDRTYMDFFGFYASNAIGMNHPKLVGDEEFKERLMDAALNKVTNSDIRTRHMARFLETFGRVAIPGFARMYKRCAAASFAAPRPEVHRGPVWSTVSPLAG